MSVTVYALLERINARLPGGPLQRVLAAGAIGAFLVDAAGMLIGFLAQVGLVRLMGSAEFGLYVYALAWIQVGVVFGKSGLDLAVVRYLPQYRVERRLDLFAGLLNRASIVPLAAGALAVLVAAAIAWLFRLPLAGERRALLVFAALIVPLLSLQGVKEAILRAFQRAAQFRMTEVIIRPLLVLAFTAALAWWSGRSVAAGEVMFFFAAAVCFCLLILRHWIARALPGFLAAADAGTIDFNQRAFADREWAAYCGHMMLSASMYLLNNRLDVLLVGYFVGVEQAGIYSVAGNIAMVTMISLNAVNIISAPVISELYHGGRLDDLQRLLRTGVRAIALATVPLALLLIVLGPFLLSLFAPPFLAGYPVLVVLVCGQVINSLSGSAGQLLIMTGHQRVVFVITLGSLLANFTLNLLLIPPYGMVGAALATAVALALTNTATVCYAQHKLGLQTAIVSVQKRPASHHQGE